VRRQRLVAVHGVNCVLDQTVLPLNFSCVSADTAAEGYAHLWCHLHAGTVTVQHDCTSVQIHRRAIRHNIATSAALLGARTIKTTGRYRLRAVTCAGDKNGAANGNEEVHEGRTRADRHIRLEHSWLRFRELRTHRWKLRRRTARRPALSIDPVKEKEIRSLLELIGARETIQDARLGD